jgi:hypothetical protein
MAPKNRASDLVAGLILLFAVQFAPVALAQEGIDPVTKFHREPIHVTAWPGGKKVAVSFALFFEEFVRPGPGFSAGPGEPQS